MSTSNGSDAVRKGNEGGLDKAPISVLEAVRRDGRVWGDLAAQYGVTNPDPPWKVTLEATCDLLAAGACALPVLERRGEEDRLSSDLYATVPFPERQLLALAHSMIKRGLIGEDELDRQMESVRTRLTSV